MYGKIFASLYQGTLRGQSHDILVFTNLIAHSDAVGYVDKHWKAVAEETGLTIEEVKSAICRLESPDPESRSSEAGGRRLERIDDHRAWGWRIVNYEKYRSLRNEETRREQNRVAQKRFRAKKMTVAEVSKVSNNGTNRNGVSMSKHRSAESAQAEAEAEAEAYTAPLTPTATVYLPRSVEEAIAMSEGAGIPEAFAKEIFLEHEGTSWSYAGKPVTNWKSYLSSRWMKVKDIQAQRERYMTAPKRPVYRAKNPAVPPSAPPAWMLQVDAIRIELARVPRDLARLAEMARSLPHDAWGVLDGFTEQNPLKEILRGPPPSLTVNPA